MSPINKSIFERLWDYEMADKWTKIQFSEFLVYRKKWRKLLAQVSLCLRYFYSFLVSLNRCNFHISLFWVLKVGHYWCLLYLYLKDESLNQSWQVPNSVLQGLKFGLLPTASSFPISEASQAAFLALCLPLKLIKNSYIHFLILN